MKEQIQKLIDDYTKKSKKLREKAEKDIYDNRANVTYNSEADLLECAVYDLKAIVKSKDSSPIEGTDADFLEYINAERKNISIELNEDWLKHTPKERVAIENLLIAYDQMADKIEQSNRLSQKEGELREALQEIADLPDGDLMIHIAKRLAKDAIKTKP